MIVGNGLLARAFQDGYAQREDVVIFASGVSNSSEVNPAAFERERVLLNRTLASKPACLVYFSTCSVDDPERGGTPYVRHKLEMEGLVSQADRWFVFRLPQVVGQSENQNTLTNNLYRSILGGQTIPVWRHARRYLVDVDDVRRISDGLISRGLHVNEVVNIAPRRSVSIDELLDVFERVTGRTAHRECYDKGASYEIQTPVLDELGDEARALLDAGYSEALVRKYYSPVAPGDEPRGT